MGGKPDRPHVKEEYSVVHNRCFSGGVLPSTLGVQRQPVRRVSRSAEVDWNFARALTFGTSIHFIHCHAQLFSQPA